MDEILAPLQDAFEGQIVCSRLRSQLHPNILDISTPAQSTVQSSQHPANLNLTIGLPRSTPS